SFAYTEDLNSDGLSQCAPELGVQADCPVTFPSATGFDHNLVGDVVQVPLGGRTVLQGEDTTVITKRDSLGNPTDSSIVHKTGSVLLLKTDTALTGGGSGYPALSDNGVTFAFVDQGVRNSFTYFYSVTAFDVNSFTSGPSSLESPRITKSATPRGAGSNV